MFTITVRGLDKIIKSLESIRKNLPTIADNMLYASALYYKDAVSSAIIQQSYAASYDPLNEEYKEWKSKAFGESRFWILTRSLLENVTAFRFGTNAWASGIPEGVTGSVNNELISKYGFWGEYGTRKQPARPLFQPSLDYFEKINLPIVIDDTKKEIGRYWR